MYGQYIFNKCDKLINNVVERHNKGNHPQFIFTIFTIIGLIKTVIDIIYLINSCKDSKHVVYGKFNENQLDIFTRARINRILYKTLPKNIDAGVVYEEIMNLAKEITFEEFETNLYGGPQNV